MLTKREGTNHLTDVIYVALNSDLNLHRISSVGTAIVGSVTCLPREPQALSTKLPTRVRGVDCELTFSLGEGTLETH